MAANPEVQDNLKRYVFTCGETTIEGDRLNPQEFYELQLRAMKHTLILQSRSLLQNLKKTINTLRHRKQKHLVNQTKEIGETFVEYHKETIDNPATFVINEAQDIINNYNVHVTSEQYTDDWFDEFYLLVEDLEYALKQVDRQLDYLNQISGIKTDHQDSNLQEPAGAAAAE